MGLEESQFYDEKGEIIDLENLHRGKYRIQFNISPHFNKQGAFHINIKESMLEQNLNTINQERFPYIRILSHGFTIAQNKKAYKANK